MRRAVLIVRVRCVLVQIFFLNVFYLNVYNSFFGWMFRKRTLFGKISQMKLAWEEILKFRSKYLFFFQVWLFYLHEEVFKKSDSKIYFLKYYWPTSTFNYSTRFIKTTTLEWGAYKLKSYLNHKCVGCYYMIRNVTCWSHYSWFYNRRLLKFYPNSFSLHRQPSNSVARVVLCILFVLWM